MYPYRLLVNLKLQKASIWRAFDELTYRQLCLIYFAVGGRGDAPTNVRAGLNETEHRKAAENSSLWPPINTTESFCCNNGIYYLPVGTLVL